MRVLVTNDDGIESEGLRRLALAAVGLGLDVVVAAPLSDASGSSASLVAVEDDGRIVVERRVLAGLEGVEAYGVAANPGLVTLLATRGAFGTAPEMVVSGINRGRNSGHAILHSGTVGAAFTGCILGCPGLAVSLDTGPEESSERHWETAAHVAAEVIPWVMGSARAFVLNVNVPDVDVAALRGLRRARLTGFGTVETVVADRGEGWVQVTVTDVEPHHEPGTDAALLAEGYATVTALQPVCEVVDVDLPIPSGDVPRSDGAARP